MARLLILLGIAYVSFSLGHIASAQGNGGQDNPCLPNNDIRPDLFHYWQDDPEEDPTCLWLLLEVASVSPDVRVIIVGSGSSITITAAPDPSGESFHELTWQRRVDGEAWENLSDTASAVTLDDTTEGIYEYQAKHGPNGTWISSGNLYVVEAEITGISGNALEGEDGPSITLTLTPDDLSTSNIQWDWEVKNGYTVGMDPNVAFSSPNSISTDTGIAKWFAYPDHPTDCNLVATYELSVSLTIESVAIDDIKIDYGVQLIAPAGNVDKPEQIAGDYDYITINREDVNGDPISTLQVITSTFAYVYPPANINVSTNSVFYDKVVAHENVHVEQRAEVFSNSEVTITVIGLTVDDGLKESLDNLVNAELEGLFLRHTNTWAEGVNDGSFEQEAYEVSDKENPQYGYQGSGL